MASITKKATNVMQTGENWSNVANIYDDDTSSYASRSVKSTSASYIDGFGFSLPSNAIVESVSIHTKAYASNSRGYLYIYLYSVNGNVTGTSVLNGESMAAGYVTQTYSASDITDVLVSKGWHNGNIVEFLNSNFRVRFVAGSTSTSLSSTVRIYDNYVTVNYSLPTYTISTSVIGGGTVTGGGTYESGKTVTLTAIPSNGYKFVSWSDGNTDASRTITVTGNATYTATFAPNPYITYDSVFSFKKWKDSGISGSNATVLAITDISFTLTSNDGALEGTSSSPYFPVEPGKSYTIDIDISGSNWDIYIFFCDADGNWIDFADGPTNRFSYDTDWGNTFTAPNKDSVVKAQIRCDANGSNNVVSFSNFRIYPAEYGYMSNSVPANERTDTDSWSIPTPTREGYTFLGWFTEPIGGTQYNSNSAFPTTDLVLYSQWKLNKINQIYIGNQLISEIYIGTQPVKAVYIGTQKIYG